MSGAQPLQLRPLRRDVAALFVMPDGPYPTLVEEWWDAARDAKLYEGPLPVVAHPPCGPWGRLKYLCKYQDASCGPRAVAQVRRWGGVLEHPQGSTLWRACDMPRPGELPDQWGGRTWLVSQVAWGHCCEKPTWLYTVGVDPRLALAGIRTGGVATRRVTSGPRGPKLPSASRRARTVTPSAFAEWLLDLAASAGGGER